MRKLSFSSDNKNPDLLLRITTFGLSKTKNAATAYSTIAPSIAVIIKMKIVTKNVINKKVPILNNSIYWETGSGNDCPNNDFTNDIVDLKCEQITKLASHLPLFHGSWSPLQPITTKPTDRFQIFGQQGPIKLSINMEIRQNNTEDTGIIDVFLDNFMWIYPKTGDIPFEIFEDVVNENKGISVTNVSSYFGVMLGITLLLKFTLKKKNI